MPKSVDNPQFRSQRARLGAYTSWANTEDRAARTLPGRRAMLDKFEKEVDPDGKLTMQERAKRAEYARKAYYQRLAMKSAAARQRRKLICQKCGQPKEVEAPMCPKCLRSLRER
jgi:rubrerythrin